MDLVILAMFFVPTIRIFTVKYYRGSQRVKDVVEIEEMKSNLHCFSVAIPLLSIALYQHTHEDIILIKKR
jgi:hypothetical protein